MFTKAGNERSLITISIGTYFLVAIFYTFLSRCCLLTFSKGCLNTCLVSKG